MVKDKNEIWLNFKMRNQWHVDLNGLLRNYQKKRSERINFKVMIYFSVMIKKKVLKKNERDA